jgi:hypothetical protein
VDGAGKSEGQHRKQVEVRQPTQFGVNDEQSIKSGITSIIYIKVTRQLASLDKVRIGVARGLIS